MSNEEILSLTNLLLSGIGLAGFFLGIWIYLTVEKRSQKLSDQISTIEQIKIQDSINEYLKVNLSYTDKDYLIVRIHNPNSIVVKIEKINSYLSSLDFVPETSTLIRYKEFSKTFEKPLTLKKGQIQEIKLLDESFDNFLAEVRLEITIVDQFENRICTHISTTSIELNQINVEYISHSFI